MLARLKAVFEESVIFGPPGTPDVPLTARVTPSEDASSKVAVIVGSNASGKSLGIRILAAQLNRDKIEPLQVSMKYRTDAGIARAFMYGPFGDASHSTGAVSLVAIQGALRTARSREEKPCWVLLDEPDVGLSEDFAYPLGEHLASCANEGLGPRCDGLVVVTHSRELVRGLTERLVTPAHFVHVDPQPQTLAEWLTTRRTRTVEDLVNLNAYATDLHRKVTRILEG